MRREGAGAPAVMLPRYREVALARNWVARRRRRLPWARYCCGAGPKAQTADLGMSERFAHGALAAKWREQSALRQLSPRGLGERGGLGGAGRRVTLV